MNSVLIVTNLCKTYPKAQKPSVDGISFEVREGEILGLLGPNGSGKTTTIQMLLGTLATSSGTITYFGKDFSRHRHEVLQDVTYASAYTGLPWSLTVQENLDILGRLYGSAPEKSAQKYEPLLERFGIGDKKRARVSSLSAGQVTRLMLVKAFFLEPRMVLLDEPTASLDPDIASEICEFILEQRDRTGMSILFTSHKMEEADDLCDRVVFLKEGKIIANDIPKNLARTVSSHRVRLTIVDGMKLMTALLEQRRLPYTIDHKMVEIVLAEEMVPSLLGEVGALGIVCGSVAIQEPSLEDYFLHVARSS
jgi:ABC-2 type transport system ATP-binding protein